MNRQYSAMCEVVGEYYGIRKGAVAIPSLLPFGVDEVRALIRHKVWPALLNKPENLLTDSARHSLQEYRKQYGYHHLRLQAATRNLFQVAEMCGVRTLLIKGEGISRAVFRGNLRAQADIDILVRPNDFELLLSTLVKNSYSFVSKDSGRAAVMVSPFRCEVDIHTLIPGVYDSDYLPFEKLWEERVELAEGGYACSMKYQYVISLLHTAKHRWCHLLHLVEYRLLRNALQEEMNEGELQQFLNEFELSTSDTITDYLSARVFRVPPFRISKLSYAECIIYSFAYRRLFKRPPNSLFQKLLGATVGICIFPSKIRYRRAIALRLYKGVVGALFGDARKRALP